MNTLKLFALTACTAILAVPTTAAPLAPVHTPFLQIEKPTTPDAFTFVVTGDNRSTGHGEPMPPSLDAICQEIGLIHPAFTLWTGDCIEGYGDTLKEANAEYDVFLGELAHTGTPVFNCPGNHEFTLDAALLPVYRQRMGDLYGSFDYGGSHFIQLNSCAVDPTGAIHDASIDDIQWAWLEKDLQDHQSAANIFVFLHHYPFGPPDDTPEGTGLASTDQRDRLHAMFVKYHVRTVYAGHNHRYYRIVKDGVEYIISGGAGAPLDGTPMDGGFLHYLVVHVNGSNVTTDVLQPWHLVVNYVKNPKVLAEAHVSNTQPYNVDLGHLVFRVAALPVGHSYAVTAYVAYKKKSKPGEARIVSTNPIKGTGKVELVVAVHAVKARATTVDLIEAEKK